MTYTETKTPRTRVVSILLGPPGDPLNGPEYTHWLDREGWNDELEVISDEALEPKAVCTVCDKAFHSDRSTAKYCSQRCKATSKRLRRRAATEVTEGRLQGYPVRSI